MPARKKADAEPTQFVFADLRADPLASSATNLSVGGTSNGPGNFDGGENNNFVADAMGGQGSGSFNLPRQTGASQSVVKKNDRRHRCNLCGKLFNRPSSLKIHLTTHTGERPFPCPFPGCGRTFNVSSNMRRHFRTHNTGGEGPSDGSSSAPPYTSQQQQHDGQLQPHQRAQAWSVNMYNPAGAQGQGQSLRARQRRSKAATAGNAKQFHNGNDVQGSEDGDMDGDQQDGGTNQNAHMYPPPPFGVPGPYGAFPPAPFMNIPGLPGMPDMPGIPDFHAMQGVPMGVQMMPIEMAFPVDPALTNQNADADADAEGDVDADAEVDADADEDADGENDGEVDGEGSNRPQLTHTTSNTRASTNAAASKTRSSARVQAKSKAVAPSTGAKGKGRSAKSAATPTQFTSPASTSSGTQQQQQVQFRQILVPVSVPMTGDPAQASRIAQQYQHQYAQYAKYAQYAQFYMQHQQMQASQGSQAQGSAISQPQPPTPVDTVVQRPGPATSAERTAPGGHAQIAPATSGNVFVHWGPKAESGAKREAKGKSDVQHGGRTNTIEATNARTADREGEGVGKLKDNKGASTSLDANATAGTRDIDPLSAGTGVSVQPNSQLDPSPSEEAARPTDAPHDSSPPPGDEEGGDGHEDVDAANLEASDKPNSGTNPRKRRKISRGRGRGRR